MMLSSKFMNLVILFIAFLAFQEQVLAIKKSYVVYLGAHSHGPEVTSADLDAVTNSHHEFLGSFLASKEDAKEAIFYSYQRHINGFAAILEEDDAAKIARHPDVVSVFLNQGKILHTTHSWNFLGLENSNGDGIPKSLWEKANFGKDMIIANLDTGVWPESQSFSDDGFGPIPCRWKGSCQNASVPCNRKLIGAHYFNKGYIAAGGKIEPWMNTARDDLVGHGTHTLSTAGGNFVPGANVFGVANGTAKGGSPKARVAAYKVCWPPLDDNGQCFDADILQAFDMALHDGVDLISLSLGGPPVPYFNDSIAIGAFHALRNNVVVVASAGNSGPHPETVSNGAPWITTVAASTLDRDFQAGVVLPNGLHFQGQSRSEALPERKYYPLINAAQANAANSSASDAEVCKIGTLDRQKVKGKILVCLRLGGVTLAEKSYSAAQAGAAGMILRNQKNQGNATYPFAYFIPSVNIGYKDGKSLIAYMNSTDDPMGYIVPPLTLLHVKPAPSLADFSSRGPNMVTPDILKPDIAAPGVDILASFSEEVSPTGSRLDQRRTPFVFMSGTSMSCPHISGIVGLLKTLHPDWSQAAIRSAIMTTAQTRDNTRNPIVEQYNNSIQATPFGYGAGYVQPNRAMDPGLVYDLTMKDYLDFLCASGYNQALIGLFSDVPYKCPENFSLTSFNYPSITILNLKGTTRVTVTRTLKNVGAPGTYAARLHRPAGVSVSVKPSVLKFEKVGEEKSFKLTLRAKDKSRLKSPVFGELIWSDGRYHVRSPITVALAAKKEENHSRIKPQKAIN